LVVDRQAIIEFGAHQTTAKKNFYNPFIAENRRLLSKWKPSGKVRKYKGSGDELDLLAIDCDQNLVCIELKRGSYSPMYYAPLQARVYQQAYKSALGRISDGIKNVVEQKIAMKLLPGCAANRLPKRNFNSVKSVVLIMDCHQKPLLSQEWQRLHEISRLIPRLERPRLVLLP